MRKRCSKLLLLKFQRITDENYDFKKIFIFLASGVYKKAIQPQANLQLLAAGLSMYGLLVDTRC